MLLCISYFRNIFCFLKNSICVPKISFICKLIKYNLFKYKYNLGKNGIHDYESPVLHNSAVQYKQSLLKIIISFVSIYCINEYTF